MCTRAACVIFIAVTVSGMCPPGEANLASVTYVVGTSRAVALKTVIDEVIIFGDATKGGQPPTSIIVATKIVATRGAFAVLRVDKRLTAWGDPGMGGGATPLSAMSDVVDVVATEQAFATLGISGAVIAWGDRRFGAQVPDGLHTGVRELYSNTRSFTALMQDATVVAWGNPACGALDKVVHDGLMLMVPVENRVETASAWSDVLCAAHSESDANSTVTSTSLATRDLISRLAIGVRVTRVAGVSYASILVDGTVVIWGNGHDVDVVLTHVHASALESTQSSFAIITSTAGIMAWGEVKTGGVAPRNLVGVSRLFSTERAFIAVTSSGSLVSWGDVDYGGGVMFAFQGSVEVKTTDRAVAVRFENQTVYAWGGQEHGGNDAVWWMNDAIRLYATGSTFVAIRRGGQAVVWGAKSAGGRSRVTPRCVTCAIGFYVSDWGSSACFECADGQWSDPGAVQCKSCPLGVCNRINLAIGLSVVSTLTILIVFMYQCKHDPHDYASQERLDEMPW